MLKKSRWNLCAFLCLGAMVVFGQKHEIQINGRVVNQEGLAVPDVQIYSKESMGRSWFTDSQGNFKISCPEGKCNLVFTHVSYQMLKKVIDVRSDLDNGRFYEIRLQGKNIDLEGISLYGKRKLSAAPTLESIKYAHKQIAGGTSVAVVTPRTQRLETIKDALKYEPGVIIQEFFGANDQPRFSIRGSGIQGNPQRRGVYFLQDGIPVNFADGSFIIGVMDPSISESIEVFKGANALRYGAATLGGAVNFNSRTGRASPGAMVKVEGGSYGFGSFTALLGDNWKKTDAFLSISGSGQDGFRLHNANRKLNMAANYGYRISNNIENRTYLNYSYIYFDVPGPLTLEMLGQDPSQINKGIDLPYYMGPNIERDAPGREATVIRVANRTAFQLSSNTDVAVSTYYQFIKDRFVFPIVLSTQRSKGNDAGIIISAERRMDKGTVRMGLLGSYGNIDRRGHINKNGLDSYMFSKDDLNAINFTFYTEYQHRFNQHLQIIGDIQAVYNERNVEDRFPDPELRPWYSHTSHKYRYFHSSAISLDQHFGAVNPRIGLIYDVGKDGDIQFFGNVSSSYEPPTFDELVGSKVSGNINTSPKELFAIKLEKQSAITAEVGSRHEGERYGWNLSLYRSWINNELLEVKDFVLGEKKTENYPHTVHQGLELGFHVVPAQGIFSTKNQDRLLLRGMYTYSNFYFSSGKYSGNTLAGVPPHYIIGALEYKQPDRFFISLNMESQPAKSPIDHSNTVNQPSFMIYGFRAGYEIRKNWSFYIESKNIFNKHYASSYIINDQVIAPPIPFPEFTVDNLALFNPGPTRAFYFGLTYKFNGQ